MRCFMGIVLALMLLRLFLEIFFIYCTTEDAGNLKNYIFLPIIQTLKLSKSFHENQLPPYPSNIKPRDCHWQAVSHTKNKFYVYSAFLDLRKGQKLVRIVAITKQKNSEKVWCRLWYWSTKVNSTTHVSKTVTAIVKMIPEYHNFLYVGHFVLCPLQWRHKVPAAVSVVAKPFYPLDNLLIVNNYNDIKPSNKIGVCVRPMIDNYNEALRVLEFFELNRILGVYHFTLYNYTMGPQVDCLLKDYISHGMVTVHPWKCKLSLLKKLHINGGSAAFNDCLYRSMYRFSYIMLIDIDEYIIPRRKYSLPELIDYLERADLKENSTTGAYMFRNVFFYIDWDDYDWTYDTNDFVANNLITLRKTRRSIELYSYHSRTKYMCKPELVVEVSNHFVREFVLGYNAYNVPAEFALLHHYRAECETEHEYDCLEMKSTVDTTIFRYSNVLITAFKERYPYLRDKCGLKDFHAPTTMKHKKIII